MMYFGLAFITTLISILPLAFIQKYKLAGIIGIISWPILWAVFYYNNLSLIYPLLGMPFVIVVVSWIAIGIIVNPEKKLNHRTLLHTENNTATYTAWIGAGGLLIFLSTFIYSWEIFHAQKYSSFIQTPVSAVWTKDIQPKDPAHMRMVSEKTAIYLARKAVAQGGIMSQYDLDENHLTLQRVNDQLIYAIPFKFKSFFTWKNTSGVPGFIIVDAENPETNPRYIETEEPMNYMPNAFFGYMLERHLRNNCSMKGLSKYEFELDEKLNPYWVVTTYTLDVAWDGEKITGIATINPVTGEIDRYSIEDAPEWIDRIIPDNFLKKYLTWHGRLANGWINSKFSQKNMTTPTDPILIYGSDGRAEWVTGITSYNGKDDSLIGLMYTDSRNGENIFYDVRGGATDDAIIQAVNANQQVKFKRLTATTPQIYNVYGTMAAVVPLINEIGAFQGLALAEVANIQDIAVGNTQSEALRQYQTLISRHGRQLALQKTDQELRITGAIDRINQDIGTNGGVYYFHLADTPRIFTASSQEWSTLPLTQNGDQVIVQYVASGETIVPVTYFSNLSLLLEQTDVEKKNSDSDSNQAKRRMEKNIELLE